MKKENSQDEFIKKSILKYNNKFNYSLVQYSNYKSCVKIICPIHGEFEQPIWLHLRKSNKCGCMKCNKEYYILKKTKKNANSFLKRAKIKFKNKFDYSLVEYKNSTSNVKIICPIHGVFMQSPHDHLAGKFGCKNCSYDSLKIKIKDLQYYIDMANLKHNFSYDYSLINKVEYFGSKTSIDIKCKNGHIFKQNIMRHANGHGCPTCASPCYNTNSLIELANKAHNFKYDYSKTIYTGSHKKITIICPKHGEFTQRCVNHISGSGCPMCKESKGERKIRYFLENNNINFIIQKTFDDCKKVNKLPFDFYLIDYNICIEYDGELHYKSVEKFGGYKKLHATQINDEFKTKYCNKNNIKLIRISYKENIIEKLKEFLF